MVFDGGDDAGDGGDDAGDGGDDAARPLDSGVVVDSGVTADSSMDSAVSTDSGVFVDSGVSMDSGVFIDSGVSMDSSVSMDSGVAVDSGVSMDSGAVDSGAVDSGVVPSCPTTADCTGVSCGPDPVCGVSCGGCLATEACVAGACECVPDCSGLSCGVDPVCGVSCGSCGATETCVAGACECVPDCSGLSCGADPVCGTSCGTCAVGEGCSAGACACAPDCSGRSCGDDGCGTSCGACAGGSFCDIAGSCLAAGVCTGALADGSMSIDVLAVDVSIDVTLNGAPLSAANSADADEGVLWLIDPVTGERINLGDTWNDATDTPVPPYALQVVPGRYDVYYGVQNDGPNWPSNTNHRLTSLDLTSSGAFVVDVPTVDVSVDVTLNGAALSAANSADADEGVLWLIDSVTSERINLGDTWNDATDTPVPPYALQVIPSAYDAYYGVQNDGPNWPSNTNHKLGALALSTSGARVVDVPTVDVSVDVTLNGAPLSAANSADADEGVLWLIDPVTTERINLGDTWNDATDTPVPPYALQVIPSTYDTYYGVQNDGPNWPSNTNHKLGALALSTSGAHTINVPTVDVSIDVTLNGAALSATNSADADEGVLWLIDPVTTERINLGDTWNDATDVPVPPYALQVIPSAYDTYYGVQNDGPNWPSNTNHKLGALPLSTSGAHTINVPTVDVSIDVTLNGAALSAANSADADEGVLWLIDPVTGERINLGDTWNDATDVPVPPYALQVIPSAYDTYYGVQNDGPNWPSNTNHKLGALALSTSGAHTIDVPTVDVLAFVTLNGAPLSAANSADADEGVLWLIDPVTSERINLGDTWNDATDTPVPPYSLQVIPSAYDVYYGVQNDGPHWPSNTNHQLTCTSFE